MRSRYVIDENVKQHWSEYRPLRANTCHRSSFGHRAVDHYSLVATIQLIPHLLNSLPIKSLSLQFIEKDVLGDRVKGLTEV